MKKNNSWTFEIKSARPHLTKQQAHRLRNDLAKTLKIGIELEYNLPETNNLCHLNNPDCQCISKYKLPDGTLCEDSCALRGKCDLEKSSGCPEKDIYCVAFESLCSACTKADKGCATCDRRWSKDKEAPAIREAVAKRLEPTRFLGKAGKCGVLDVVPDHSLTGGDGIEIVTVGQRVSFAHMHNMCKEIISTAKEHGAFVNERTSVHFHILSGYLSTGKYNPKRPNYGLPGGMEKPKRTLESRHYETIGVASVGSVGEYGYESSPPVPTLDGVDLAHRDVSDSYAAFLQRESRNGQPFEIADMETAIPEVVLANFHQLWRRYENAFVWLTSTGDKRNRLTRWAKFRRSLLKYGALRHPMPRVFEEIRNSMDSNRRYAMVNYEPVRFSPDGDIERLHFEIRVSDGCLSPASVAAQACLLHALLLKAVDLSCHGILKSGDSEYMQLAHEIAGTLCNNTGSWDGSRHSDTSGLDPYIATLEAQATEMVRLCKSFLVDDIPSYDVLLSLAKKPISMRRCSGKTWEEIEKELLPISNGQEIDSNVMIAIDTALLTECSSKEQWVSCISEDNGLVYEKVLREITALVDNGCIFWNASLGSFCRR